jgi:cellulose biosynthesis protein BcsQ
MGPVLFNICINDLQKNMGKLSHTTLCANDTNIIVTSTKYNDLHKTGNVTLQLICEWFQINQLVLNKNKIFVIRFHVLKLQLIP